ncbi:MAG: hypothetical protein BWZ01_02549 [Deltaproteobacteria bacterium ADurb.BinA179]|nr:MAG: hypothetical protein BWZ01_02549 [Deltaproteobacteria bacterium ADurb.BinA179]
MARAVSAMMGSVVTIPRRAKNMSNPLFKASCTGELKKPRVKMMELGRISSTRILPVTRS